MLCFVLFLLSAPAFGSECSSRMVNLTKLAEQGNTTAQNSLAMMYWDGEDVEQSYEKALGWYTKAAKNGDANAQNNLAIAYYNGHGVERSYAKAVEWYMKAAEQGDADGQYHLANM